MGDMQRRSVFHKVLAEKTKNNVSTVETGSNLSVQKCNKYAKC